MSKPQPNPPRRGSSPCAGGSRRSTPAPRPRAPRVGVVPSYPQPLHMGRNGRSTLPHLEGPRTRERAEAEGGAAAAPGAGLPADPLVLLDAARQLGHLVVDGPPLLHQLADL